MKEPMLGMPSSDSGECCSEEDAQDVLDAIKAGDAKGLALVLNRIVEGHYEEPDEDDSKEA